MWSDWLVFCDCGLHFVCPLMNKDKEAYGSFLIGETDCGKSWILFWWAGPFSVNLLTFCWWAGLCPLPVVWPEAKLLTHWRLPDTHRQVWQSLVATPSFSWLPMHTGFGLCPPRVCFPSPVKFCNQIPLASRVKFPGAFQSLCWIPGLGNLLWVLELS